MKAIGNGARAPQSSSQYAPEVQRDEGGMKYKIKLLAAIVTLSSCTVAAHADQVDLVLATLGKQGVPKMCGKANAMAGMATLRSFQGILCQRDYIAASAEILCAGPNTDNYANSQCHQYAVAALKGKDPAEVLQEAVKNGTGKAREFACGRAGIPDVVQAACQKWR